MAARPRSVRAQARFEPSTTASGARTGWHARHRLLIRRVTGCWCSARTLRAMSLSAASGTPWAWLMLPRMCCTRLG